MHHTLFKLGMVLWLGVLHLAYWIHVRQLSTSCFSTYFIFRHNMVKCQIFVTLCSATMHHSHFKLGMVLWLGVKHLSYWIHVHQLSTSCFLTYFILRHNMVKCQIFVTLCSATMHHSHFKLGLVLCIGVLQVAYWSHIHQLSISFFRPTLFLDITWSSSKFSSHLAGV